MTLRNSLPDSITVYILLEYLSIPIALIFSS